MTPLVHLGRPTHLPSTPHSKYCSMDLPVHATRSAYSQMWKKWRPRRQNCLPEWVHVVSPPTGCQLIAHPKQYINHSMGQDTRGEFLKPFMLCQRDPPMAPIANAVPQSSRILQGLVRKMQSLDPLYRREFSLPRVSSMIHTGHSGKRFFGSEPEPLSSLIGWLRSCKMLRVCRLDYSLAFPCRLLWMPSRARIHVQVKRHPKR